MHKSTKPSTLNSEEEGCESPKWEQAAALRAGLKTMRLYRYSVPFHSSGCTNGGGVSLWVILKMELAMPCAETLHAAASKTSDLIMVE
jgi:hypothetical protein